MQHSASIEWKPHLAADRHAFSDRRTPALRFPDTDAVVQGADRPAGGRFLPDQMDAPLFTHINFAFAIFGFVTRSVAPNNPHLTGDFWVQPVEWNIFYVSYL